MAWKSIWLKNGGKIADSNVSRVQGLNSWLGDDAINRDRK